MKKTLISVAVLVATMAPALGIAAENNPALEQKVQQLSRELDDVKTQLGQLKSQNEALAAQQESVNARASGANDNLHVSGYGEIAYTRPKHQKENAKADLARAVIGLGYRFDDKTRFASEFEIEHAVTSAEDSGEYEVEQFYVDHQLLSSVAIKGGLFLIPAGLLNTAHEPPNYYGTQRNFVETLIIPSTWREGGVGAHGNTDSGFGWDVGFTTGMNIANWEINPEVPRFATADDLGEGAPFGETHQELSNANAEHFSQYVALSYNGAGLTVGGSVFTGNMGKFQPETSDQRATLWELHTRWTQGPAELSALYARGSISNTEEVNRLYPGASNLIPAKFFGGYVQAAYTVWEHDHYRVVPFARVERFNAADEIKGVAEGEGSDGLPTERVFTWGASFYLHPQVVIKADYQTFKENSDFNRLNLGLGLAF
jgi:outer membrane murein-binding lipoprotein Lpp